VAAVTELGFSILPDCATTIAGDTYASAVLDMGAASVDGWFERLVARELSIEQAVSWISELVRIAGSKRASLTRRGFDTLY
jgi:hypothetical protein